MGARAFHTFCLATGLAIFAEAAIALAYASPMLINKGGLSVLAIEIALLAGATCALVDHLIAVYGKWTAAAVRLLSSNLASQIIAATRSLSNEPRG